MRSKLNNFSFLICAVLSCVGTYLTLGQTGIIKFFFIAPICALVIGLLKDTSGLLKASLFSLFSLIYSFVFLEGERRIIAFAVMTAMALIGILFGRFVSKAKEKRIFGSAAIGCAVVCFLGATVVFGSPIDALANKQELDEYIGSKYADDEFTIDDIVYDGSVYGYTVTAKNDKTAYGLRIYKAKDGRIVDEYLTHLKRSLMRENAERITTVLREHHPNDGFTVYGKDVWLTSPPFSVFDETDHSENMQFYIYLSNELLSSDFAKRARQYYEELLEANVDFSSITFIGGEKGQMLFELTATGGYAANSFDKLLEKHDHFEFLVSSIDFK